MHTDVLEFTAADAAYTAIVRSFAGDDDLLEFEV